jgi:hypothetical protein
MAASKLAAMKDSKHFWAQGGTKFRISGVTAAVSAAAAVAESVVDIARHSKDSRCAILPSNIWGLRSAIGTMRRLVVSVVAPPRGFSPSALRTG